MLLSDVLAIVFSGLGALLAFQGLWLLCRGVWPKAVAAAAADFERTLWKPFLVGLPATVITVLVIGPLSKVGGPGGICAIALLSVVVLVSSIGVAGLASVVGSRLNGGRTTVKTMVLGGVALELAFVFPLVGWLVVLPITLVLGLGAAIRAMIPRGGNKAAKAEGTTSGAAQGASSTEPAGMPK